MVQDESPNSLSEEPAAAIVASDVLEMVGDLQGEARAEIFRSLLTAFETESAVALHDIANATFAEDPKLLAAAVHRLKGTSWSVGARLLGRICEETERAIGAADLRAAFQTPKRIRDEVSRVCTELALLA